MNGEPSPPAVRILLVEDNPTDVLLTREALKQAGFVHTLEVAKDGVEAIERLRSAEARAEGGRPDLILLDLNLPRKDGRELLAEIKGDPDLKVIPVVVLSSSRAPEDVLHSYRLHANAYMAKPIGFREFLSLIRAFEGFWARTALLPGRSAGSS